MLDTFSKKQNNFIMLVDKEQFGVLTTSISPSVINALTTGFDNTEAVLATIKGPDALKALRTYNQNAEQSLRLRIDYNDPLIIEDYEVQHETVGAISNVFGVQPYEKPEGFTLKRKIANRRQHVLLQIESKLERYAGRVVNSPMDDIFIPYMSDEINKCKPNEDQYTDALIEWANASSLDVKQAYNHCKMVTESTNITMMRLHAHWRYFVGVVNKLDFLNEGSAEKVIADAEIRLRSGL